MKFDPVGVCSRFVAESAIHRIIQGFMILVLLGFLLHRARQYHLFAVKALWFAESALFVVLIIAYLFRSAPVNRSTGVQEILVPLVGSALPFALLLTPPLPAVIAHRAILLALLWGMATATGLTVAGMWSLRRSFSITVEARKLVTTGPYRLVRHPVYCGEMLAAAAVAAIRLSVVNVALLSLFVAIQLYRTRLEENKLSATFPEYRQFARDSWWFWR
jgi:protein-S-isoprenylcysteine O-methyltransferase Ste14